MFISRISIILFIFLFTQCSENCINLDVDIKNRDIDLKYFQFEKELFSSKMQNLAKHHFLLEKYKRLYALFYAEMLNEGNPYSEKAPNRLQQFIEHPSTEQISSSVFEQFKDFSTYQNKIESAFKHFNYYFPDSSLPSITTMYTNFNANTIEVDNTIAIGLEMYLGEKNTIIQSLPSDYFPQFVKQKMNPNFLVSDVIHCVLHNRFHQQLGEDFLSEIVSLGKISYLIEVMTPEDDKNLKFRYSNDELAWCQQNEKNIWETVVNQNLLYSKDKKQLNHFISTAPFTKGLPKESPSGVGIWLGYRIVKDYVEKNCIDVKALINEKNVKNILKSYNPNE